MTVQTPDIQAVLERRGKPLQAVELDVNGNLNLAERIAAARKRVAEFRSERVSEASSKAGDTREEREKS